MLVICCICDHENEVPEGMEQIICEMCTATLNVYEDGSTDVM